MSTIKLRRGTAAAWTSANPVLASGELGLETDTLKIKFGNGATAWNSLAYHAATAIPIVDAGSYFTGASVEAALQELGAAGGGGAPTGAKYIVQTPDSGLSSEQALSALATGILKSTTATGVVSIATPGTDYYNPAGTDVALADGGTGASLADPNADRILFWDDSAGQMTWLVPGTGLAISGTTLDVTVGGGSGAPFGLRRIEIVPFLGRTVVQGTWTYDIDATYQANFLNGYVYNSTVAQNDEITFQCPMEAGTWTIEAMNLRASNNGIMTFSIDGSSVGTIDTYSAVTSKNAVGSIAGITVATTGMKTLSLKIATKNGSSSGYRINLQFICLTRTGA